MSTILRIDLEILWADMMVDREYGTDRGLIKLSEILGYKCNEKGERIEEMNDRPNS